MKVTHWPAGKCRADEAERILQRCDDRDRLHAHAPGQRSRDAQLGSVLGLRRPMARRRVYRKAGRRRGLCRSERRHPPAGRAAERAFRIARSISLTFKSQCAPEVSQPLRSDTAYRVVSRDRAATRAVLNPRVPRGTTPADLPPHPTRPASHSSGFEKSSGG